MCSLTSVFGYFTEVDSTRKNYIVGKYAKSGTSDKPTIGGGGQIFIKRWLSLYILVYFGKGVKNPICECSLMLTWIWFVLEYR